MGSAARKERSKSVEIETVKPWFPVKIQTLRECGQELIYLFNIPTNTGLAKRFALFAKQINPILTDIEEKRIELCKSFGPLNDKTGNYVIPPERQEEFDAGIKALVDVEVQIFGKPLMTSELGKIEISGMQLLKLDWFIK